MDIATFPRFGADISEDVISKREKARQRQIKCRLQSQHLQGCCDACGFIHNLQMPCVCVRCHSWHLDTDCPSPEFSSSVGYLFPNGSLLPAIMKKGCCDACGFKHDPQVPCVCVRCHSRHPDSDCPLKSFRSQTNHHYRITTGRCVLCGYPHADDLQCPPVSSFEFYYCGSDCLTDSSLQNICIMCSSQHDSDMSCPCVRCHTRHPDADCPTLSADQSGGALCRICSLMHPPHLSCRCVVCHSRHPIGDCPRAPVPRQCHTSVTSAIRSLALTVNVDNTVAHSCGSMSVVCPYCRSRSWKHERLNCCNDGHIDVPQLNVVPAELSDLILSSHVRSNFRIYNSVMALASVGHSNKSVVGGTFVLGGSAYHRIGSLIPGASCVTAA